MQYLILFRAVDTDVLGSAKIANLRIKGCQLRHFNKSSEAFLLNDVVCDGELIVGRLLRKDGCPCVKAVDTLLFQSLRAQILEQKIQFRQTIGNGRSRKKCCSQVLAGPLLYGTNGKEHV